MSASFGSTATFSKYQPRPQIAWSAATRVHVAPASSERKRPPSPGSAAAPPPPPPPRPPPAGGGTGGFGSAGRQSMIAYTRRGFVGATAMPVRPMRSAGNPFVSCFQVLPPSVDLKMPPPGPLDGEYEYHGGRRVF